MAATSIDMRKAISVLKELSRVGKESEPDGQVKTTERGLEKGNCRRADLNRGSINRI